MMYITTKNKGFTLIETLFYISGLVVLLTTIVTILIYMYDWYKVVTIPPRVEQVGLALVDKIVKDIRSSEIINSSQSNLNTTNGAISVTGYSNSVSQTKKYLLSNGRMKYIENSQAEQFVSPSGMTITNFNLNSLSSGISTGVKFDIDISYYTKQGTTTKTFNGFGILRQSYE